MTSLADTEHIFIERKIYLWCIEFCIWLRPRVVHVMHARFARDEIINSLRENKTGTSLDDDASKSNNWLDQWQSSTLSTGSRVQSFSRAFPSSTDVPVLLLNQPNVSVRGFIGFARGRNTRRKAYSCEKYIKMRL